MIKKFHKWWHGAVQGLGVLCLWYEIARLFDVYWDAKMLGVIIGMFVIGWGYSYENENKKD